MKEGLSHVLEKFVKLESLRVIFPFTSETTTKDVGNDGTWTIAQAR